MNKFSNMKKITLIALTIVLSIPALVRAQTCGTTNIAQGTTATSSSNTAFHEAGEAVDGNLGEGWYTTSSVDTSWIYVDLGQSYNVCKVKIYWTSNGRGKDYKVQISNNTSS